MKQPEKLTDRERTIAIDAMKTMYRILKTSGGQSFLDPLKEWQEKDVENHHIRTYLRLFNKK